MAKRKNSRAKGNSYELKLSKLLKEWDPSFNYRRTPLSGGWDKQHAPGDVMMPEWFPWIFEAKNREGWHMEQILKSPDKNQVLSWYREECDKQGSEDILLVFTKNFDSNYFLLRNYNFTTMNKYFGPYSDPLMTFYTKTIDGEAECYQIGLFEDLLDWLDPVALEHYYNEDK